MNEGRVRGREAGSGSRSAWRRRLAASQVRWRAPTHPDPRPFLNGLQVRGHGAPPVCHLLLIYERWLARQRCSPAGPSWVPTVHKPHHCVLPLCSGLCTCTPHAHTQIEEAVTNECSPGHGGIAASLAGGAPAGAEDLAPLQAPLGQHLAPRRGCHAGPESRHTRPFPVHGQEGVACQGHLVDAPSPHKRQSDDMIRPAAPHTLPPAAMQRVSEALLVVGLDQERPAHARQRPLHWVDDQVCIMVWG